MGTSPTPMHKHGANVQELSSQQQDMRRLRQEKQVPMAGLLPLSPPPSLSLSLSLCVCVCVHLMNMDTLVWCSVVAAKIYGSDG